MKKIFSFLAAILLAGSMMADNLYTIDFKAGQGEWTIDNVELGGLDYVWSQTSQYGMKASGFANGENHVTESWLISPDFDLSEAASAKLIFSHARRYGELNQLSVKVKVGNGSWADLTVSAWPDGSSWDFIDAEADLASYVGGNIQIAFVYTSSAEAGATWEISSLTITDGGEIIPPVLETITVAQALEIGAALAADTQSEDKYLVEGFVTQIDDDGFDTYKNMTFWIADVQGTAATNADGAFEVYRGKPEGKKVAVGDKVSVETAIKNFKGNLIESETGAKVTFVEETGVENIVLTEKAQKVMVDGVVYIVRDNKLFNVQGTQIR